MLQHFKHHQFFYIFILHYKKKRNSNQKFRFPIFLKKKKKKTHTYEDPKKIDAWISFESWSNLVAPLQFNCPPIEIISGTSKRGSNISCNDLIEANRIEASRSWSKSPRGRVEESKFLANLIPTLNYRSRRIPWAALTFNPLVCFTGSEGGKVERWLDGARNTTARSLHPVFRHFILGLTFHPGESTDREPTGLLCDRVAHIGE